VARFLSDSLKEFFSPNALLNNEISSESFKPRFPLFFLLLDSLLLALPCLKEIFSLPNPSRRYASSSLRWFSSPDRPTVSLPLSPWAVCDWDDNTAVKAMAHNDSPFCQRSIPPIRSTPHQVVSLSSPLLSFSWSRHLFLFRPFSCRSDRV